VAGYTIEDAVDPDGVAFFICNLRDRSDLFSVEVNAGCIDAADRNKPWKDTVRSVRFQTTPRLC
jgi:hypothetical protein